MHPVNAGTMSTSAQTRARRGSTPISLLAYRLALLAVVLCSGCAHGTLDGAVDAAAGGWRAPSPLFDPALTDALLESPDRDAWQKPKEIVESLRIRPGMRVADVGAGSGYLLPYLSRAVGPEGYVYAEEIQKPFLKRLRQRAKGFPNVRVVEGAPADPHLPRGIDRFVLLTVYHEVDGPVEFLKTLRKYAKPESELAIIDFDAARKGHPPAPPGHEMAESAAVSEAESAGWSLLRKHDFLSSQFFLVFRTGSREMDGE